jgi:hypothetical protein
MRLSTFCGLHRDSEQRLLKQQAPITVHDLLTKEITLPFSVCLYIYIETANSSTYTYIHMFIYATVSIYKHSNGKWKRKA